MLVSSIYGTQPGSLTNSPIDILNHWQRPGDHAQFARYSTTSPNYTTSAEYSGLDLESSDISYSDGSYIRLRNLSLSYDLPHSWLQKTGVSGCRIYFRGENLFILTRYNGIDPETPGFGALPPAKTLTGGIQFSF